ncbi:PET117 domain-containing protein [Phanerochaete sordida]|uniref:PET117 domain-containing protein n=1 Tax=Phanerochaete sordida TaxID=48140 RepID=A0A9P3GAY8_9APHY|nr:PET117 domain-containing protein [Phanerochaete sordida]
MSRAAKATLVGSLLFSVGIIYTVHFMQRRESETMFQGVLRDDERRKEKMRQRQADFEESQRKRALYEQVQHVQGTDALSTHGS